MTEARTTHRAAAWRLVLGGALIAFALGTYLGNQVWTDEPEPTVVWFERAHTPQEAP